VQYVGQRDIKDITKFSAVFFGHQNPDPDSLETLDPDPDSESGSTILLYIYTSKIILSYLLR
jgi:hypothetical protein